MRRILFFVISMSGLTHPSVVCDQQYVAWLKKVDDDVHKSGIDKAERGNGTGRELWML